MSQEIKLSDIKSKAKKAYLKFSKHITFVVVILVLMIYLYMVWRIQSFTSAEPTPEAESAALAETNIPKIDPKAIEQIQSLEASSAELQAIINQARNNPFLE